MLEAELVFGKIPSVQLWSRAGAGHGEQSAQTGGVHRSRRLKLWSVVYTKPASPLSDMSHVQFSVDNTLPIFSTWTHLFPTNPIPPHRTPHIPLSLSIPYKQISSRLFLTNRPHLSSHFDATF